MSLLKTYVQLYYSGPGNNVFLRSILFEETSYDMFSKNLKANVILRNLVAKFRTGDTLDGAARGLRNSWCWPSSLKQSE